MDPDDYDATTECPYCGDLDCFAGDCRYDEPDEPDVTPDEVMNGRKDSWDSKPLLCPTCGQPDSPMAPDNQCQDNCHIPF